MHCSEFFISLEICLYFRFLIACLLILNFCLLICHPFLTCMRMEVHFVISDIVNVSGQFSHEIICGKALTLPLSLTLAREPVLSSTFIPASVALT